jgi:hypothetical protein
MPCVGVQHPSKLFPIYSDLRTSEIITNQPVNRLTLACAIPRFVQRPAWCRVLKF